MNGLTLDPHSDRVVCFGIALLFGLLGVFAPTITLAGALKFLRGNQHEAHIGRAVAFLIAASALLAAFFHYPS